MITFKETLLESALERKIKKGSGKTQFDVPGAPIVHHDGETTVYHLHHPRACRIMSTGMRLCTTSSGQEEKFAMWHGKGVKWHEREKEELSSNIKRRHNFVQGYLNDGNLFMIHHPNGERSQYFVPHTDRKEPELVNTKDGYYTAKSIEMFKGRDKIGVDLKKKLDSIPHNPPKAKDTK